MDWPLGFLVANATWWMQYVVVPVIIALVMGVILILATDPVKFVFAQTKNRVGTRRAQRRYQDEEYVKALKADSTLLQIDFSSCELLEVKSLLLVIIGILTPAFPLYHAAATPRPVLPTQLPFTLQDTPLNIAAAILVFLGALTLFLASRWRELLMEGRRAHVPSGAGRRWLMGWSKWSRY